MRISLTDSSGNAVLAKVECDVKLRPKENPDELLVFYCTKNVLSCGVMPMAVRRVGNGSLWSGANLYVEGTDGAMTIAEAKAMGRDIAARKQRALRKSLDNVHNKMSDEEWPHLHVPSAGPS